MASFKYFAKIANRALNPGKDCPFLLFIPPNLDLITENLGLLA
jgi:hypothetical protein